MNTSSPWPRTTESRSCPYPPPRGLIFDRNGLLLADNLPSYRLEITPEEVADLEATLGKLAGLVELEEADINTKGGSLRLIRPTSLFF